MIDRRLHSIQTATHLKKNNQQITQNFDNISTGRRLQKAADDPAGLSISLHMDSDKKTMKQAVRNANDGISMLHQAESSLEGISNILDRLRLLAVRASNDTYSTNDRSTMDTEYTNLIGNLQKIVSTTQYNQKNLLSNGGNLQFQVGINDKSDDRILLNLSTLNATLGNLGITTLTQQLGPTSTDAQTRIETLEQAFQEVNNRRAYLGALQSRMESSIEEAIESGQNLELSSSRIIDTDYATESASLTKHQLINQAGVAAAGQAKSIPQSIVTLLS